MQPNQRPLFPAANRDENSFSSIPPRMVNPMMYPPHVELVNRVGGIHIPPPPTASGKPFPVVIRAPAQPSIPIPPTPFPTPLPAPSAHRFQPMPESRELNQRPLFPAASRR